MRILLLLFTVIYCITAHSQTEPVQEVFDEIVVSSNRTENLLIDDYKNIEIITKEAIESAAVSSLFELLQSVAGLDVRERGVHGVQADLSLRGSTFEQVLVLINGIRMSDPQTGHHSAYIPVDLKDIERIEIVKGSAARIYGQNAFAGAINIITKEKIKNQASIGLQYGENNLYGLRASAQVQNGNSNHLLSLSRNNSDGYRFNSDYNIDNIFYQGNLKTNKVDYQLMGGFTNKRFGANGFYASPDFVDQYEKVQTSIVSLGAKYKFNKGFIQSRAYWRRNQDD
ncbi:MAG: TonB-dependent receptor plug domain-containing protein, partial [Bacteroidota bacterium]